MQGTWEFLSFEANLLGNNIEGEGHHVGTVHTPRTPEVYEFAALVAPSAVGLKTKYAHGVTLSHSLQAHIQSKTLNPQP